MINLRAILLTGFGLGSASDMYFKTLVFVEYPCPAQRFMASPEIRTQTLTASVDDALFQARVLSRFYRFHE